jgi:hypothetical protein
MVDMNDPAAREASRMLERLYARLVRRRPDFRKRREYFEGKQPLNFATEEWKKANAERYLGFSDNWTGPVAAAEAERIDHIGVKLDEQQFNNAAKKLWQAWRANELQMQSSQGFLSSLVTSRTFVLVWGDPTTDEPVVTWETGNSTEIEYDWFNPRKRTAAVKTWVDEDYEYANLYTADALWKFYRAIPQKKSDQQSQADQATVDAGAIGGFTPRELASEPWPLPNPMGEVPIVEMPNRPILGGDPISEIAGTMAMQDAINLLWAYMFLAADYASMDARIITGTAPPMIPVLDKDGQLSGERPVPMKELYEKRIAFFTGENVKAQSWPKADLSGFLEVIDAAVGHISSQTRTPPTYLISKAGMSNVSADGLKASEIGLVKKTIEFQRFISPALREVYRLIALAMGDDSLAKAARLATIQWANPEIRSESQLADMLTKKKSIGYPLEYLLELDGMDPVEVDRVLAMVEQERNDPQLAAAMRGLDGSSGGGGAVPGAAASGGNDSGGNAPPVAPPGS